MAGSIGAGLLAGAITGGAAQLVDLGDQALAERAQMRRDQAKALLDAVNDGKKGDKDKDPKTITIKKFNQETGMEEESILERDAESGRYSDIITDEVYGKYERVLDPLFKKGMTSKEANDAFYQATGQRVPAKVMKMFTEKQGYR